MHIGRGINIAHVQVSRFIGGPDHIPLSVSRSGVLDCTGLDFEQANK